jgi:hypothetical protein
MNKSEQKLRELAQDDPLMHQLLSAYDHQQWATWEAFLVDCILTLASTKNALHDRLEELYAHGMPPIVFQVSPDELEHIRKQVES